MAIPGVGHAVAEVREPDGPRRGAGVELGPAWWPSNTFTP